MAMAQFSESILFTDVNKVPVFEGSKVTFEFHQQNHTDVLELTGVFVWNESELRYEIDIDPECGHHGILVLSYVPEHHGFNNHMNNFRVVFNSELAETVAQLAAQYLDLLEQMGCALGFDRRVAVLDYFTNMPRLDIMSVSEHKRFIIEGILDVVSGEYDNRLDEIYDTIKFLNEKHGI